ncbi:P-loop containing nucleoside triphosphate hydrolase protein [Geopyxis carbonaria]|nr:P-loop containing nucleoside triphosphate hydrolase protein [Geopyxis carbonaria]
MSTTIPLSSPKYPTPAPFIPRGTFEKPGNITNSYYLGHHKRGLERIQQTLGSVDMVLECRDYRVPLSSRNPMFEEALQGKERVIVYTKRDLGQVVLTEQTRNIITNWHKPNKVIFADTGNKGHIKEIVTHLQDTARDLEKLTGMRVLIVGMPNVGKSSLLNTLARVGAGNTNKVARTGRQPGVTRKLSTTIKISDDPLIYVIDTPGIFVPYLPNPITMLKLALVGSIKDNLVPPMTLADFLLFHMNRNGVMSKYRIWSKPTDALVPFLTGVARQTGRLKKGGEPLLTDAATWIINRYRRGDLGRFMLDDVHKGGLQEAVEEEEGWGESDTAARRRIKKEIVAAKKKKHVKGGAQV